MTITSLERASAAASRSSLPRQQLAPSYGVLKVGLSRSHGVVSVGSLGAVSIEPNLAWEYSGSRCGYLGLLLAGTTVLGTKTKPCRSGGRAAVDE